jgi:hypothetical protein
MCYAGGTPSPRPGVTRAGEGSPPGAPLSDPTAVPTLDLQLLAANLMDIRSMTESLRRSITNAQSSVEQLRHDLVEKPLLDIADCLRAIRNEVGYVLESADAAQKPLDALLIKVSASPEAPVN